MSIYGSAFARLSRNAQQALATVASAAAKFNAALGASMPRPELAAGQNATTASESIEAYEREAETVSGPSLDTLLGRSPPSSAPSWADVSQLSASTGRSVRAAVEQLRAAYERAGEISVAGRTLDSRAVRAYLAQRLQRPDVPRSTGDAPITPGTPAAPPVEPVRVVARPRGLSTMQKGAIALGVLALLRGRRGR